MVTLMPIGYLYMFLLLSLNQYKKGIIFNWDTREQRTIIWTQRERYDGQYMILKLNILVANRPGLCSQEHVYRVFRFCTSKQQAFLNFIIGSMIYKGIHII